MIGLRGLVWHARHAACAASLPFAFALGGCVAPLSEPPDANPDALAVGESRTVELRFLRFDVSNFEQTLAREDILALPADVRDRLWLLDLDLRSGPTTPRLLDNALEAIKTIDPSTLSPAARNMQALLKMTPDTANLEGTKLEELIGLAPILGLAPERVLADLLGVDIESEILSPAVISQVVLDQVISTHPNTHERLGPRTEANPEGVYPVAPGMLSVTLADAAADFASLGQRYGEVYRDGVYHPGFIAGETKAAVLLPDFAITVRANANALPYKGVDLSNGSEASVNSIRGQIDHLFDFDDPNWLQVEGLVPGEPKIESLTFRIVEDDRFISGGRSPIPFGIGDSPGFELAPWTLERIVLGAGRASFVSQDARVEYIQPGQTDPLFLAEVVDGWQTMTVQGDVGSPPPPSYLWDLLLEIAQVRLHDGGIEEGTADVEFTLSNIGVGTDSATIERTMRENLAADPISLLGIANTIIDSTRGEADFYYVRIDPTTSVEVENDGDWLYFITEDDIAKDDQGAPVRPYSYAYPGFFADAGLTTRISSRTVVDGDSEHEKVRVVPGDVLYSAGPDGSVYRIEVGEKPSRARISLTVTRVQ